MTVPTPPDVTTLQSGAELNRLVLERVSAWADQLGPGLHAAWRELSQELDLRGDGGPPYFLHPLALPVLQLPAWMAASPSLPDTAAEPALAAAESAAVGYLHVRIRDDWIDDGRVPSTPRLLLSDLLLHRHLDLLCEAGDHRPAVRRAAAKRWAQGAAALLVEEQVQRGETPCDRNTFQRILDRSRALALPTVALLHGAARTELVPRIEALVDALVEAHQLHVDLIDFEKDLAANRLSWLLHRAGADEGPDRARRWLMLEGGCDEVLADIHSACEQAKRQAGFLDLPLCSRYVHQRLEQAESLRRSLFSKLLSRIAGSSPTMGSDPTSQ